MPAAQNLQNIIAAVSRRYDDAPGFSIPIPKVSPLLRFAVAPGFGTDLFSPPAYDGPSLVGVLFCPPETPPGKDEVIGNLSYFHHRSGEWIDFYCIGYCTDCTAERDPGRKTVADVNGSPWYFSPLAFTEVVGALEEKTKWEYSGEAELLLFNVVKQGNGTADFDFKQVLRCRLEAMLRDQAITSVRAFFEDIFRLARGKGKNAWGVSDSLGVKLAKGTLKDAILDLLPDRLHSAYRQGEHLAIQSLV